MLSLLHHISPFGEKSASWRSGVCVRGEVLNQQVNLTLDCITSLEL